VDFIDEKVQAPAFIICNSVGGARRPPAAAAASRAPGPPPRRGMQRAPASCRRAPHARAGLAGLRAAIDAPERVRGVQLIDISLRGLHEQRTSPLARPFIAAFQRLLRETSIGQAFFGNVATPQVGPGARAVAAVPRRVVCCPAPLATPAAPR
jgi:hypothetical protein